jgi:hypothetical protein
MWMQAIFSMLAGMIVLGSVIYRFSTVNRESLSKAVVVSVFVYLSLSIGLLLSSYGEVVAFQRQLVENLIIDLKPNATGFYWMYGISLGSALLVGVKERRIQDAAATFCFVLIICLFGSACWNYLHSTSFGHVITFAALMISMALINAALGIIAVGVNLAFIIIQFGKGQSIDLFSLINFIDVVHPESLIVSLAILVLSSVLGSLELVINGMGLGGH